MAGRDSLPDESDRRLLTGVRVIVLAVAVLAPGLAAADSRRPVQLAHVAATQAPATAAEPDMFDRIARWFDRTFGGLNHGLKETFAGVGQFGERTRGAFKDMADGVSESAESVAALSHIRIVSKRQRCEPAPNGAPDCRHAAEVACRSRGYASGKSIETQSERVCSAPKLFSQASQPTCRTESYVLRSICQ